MVYFVQFDIAPDETRQAGSSMLIHKLVFLQTYLCLLQISLILILLLVDQPCGCQLYHHKEILATLPGVAGAFVGVLHMLVVRVSCRWKNLLDELT